MSGAIPVTAAGESHGGAAPRRRSRLTPVTAAIAATTLLGLGLRAYLLARPGLEAVTQYDDGPYFGSAVRLVHGVLPYRGYAFVQPPGITLLMSPAAALTYLTGTARGLVLARILTVLAGAASVPLTGLLVRHRGTVATVAAGGVAAVYPPAAAAAHTVLLEPWLVLFCLLGTLAVFEGDRLVAHGGAGRPGGWRLAWGGAAFGFAGAVKVWAIVPVLAVLVLCCFGRRAPGNPPLRRRGPRRAGPFAAGVAAGFVVPVLPFALAAPWAFYDSVVVAQLARIGARTPALARLHAMLGLPGIIYWPRAWLLWLLAGVLAVAAGIPAALWLATPAPGSRPPHGRRAPPALDWFALLTTLAVAGMFLWPPYFSAHYVAFLAPFLALSLALPVSRLLAAMPAPGSRAWPRRWLAPPAAVLAAAALVTAAVIPTLATVHPPSPRPAVIKRVIPPGACVVTDQASYLLVADRFVSRVPGCSQMVDSLGTDLALSGGRRPSSGAAAVPAVRAAWRAAFGSAQYALLSSRARLRVPWTRTLGAYFRRHFRPVLRTRDFVIYARTGPGRPR